MKVSPIASDIHSCLLYADIRRKADVALNGGVKRLLTYP